MAKKPKDQNIADDFEKEYELSNLSPSAFKVASRADKLATFDISGKPTRNSIEILKRFFANKFAFIALIFFIAIVLFSIFASIISPYNAEAPISGAKSQFIIYLPPRWLNGGDVTRGIADGTDPFLQELLNSNIKFTVLGEPNALYIVYNPWVYLEGIDQTSHFPILGTDVNGRDIWTRLWIGTRRSLQLAVSVAVVETTIGIGIGAYIGFHAGGRFDTIMMRIVEIISSVPALIWFILLIFILPAGFWSMFIALVVVGWLRPVGTTRMFILRVKDAEYIKAAEAIGVSKTGRIYNHALMNVVGKIAILFVQRIPLIIFIEASLSFLGISPDPTLATLGNLINEAKGQIQNWWYITSTTIVMLVITLSLQLVALGLHDAFDPRTGRK